MTAPVAGSITSSEPPIAGRHCAPNRRPRHVDSIRILGIGAFIPHVLPAALSSALTIQARRIQICEFRLGVVFSAPPPALVADKAPRTGTSASVMIVYSRSLV